ncbi:MAG: hypothetical protein MRZ79_05100 [Bacteroidia bacterium]|nr:hypothetical protein [Bacteroidia bacterium]
MIFFIELWNTKPAWHELTAEERGNYMANIGPHIQDLMAKGVKILTWSDNLSQTTRRADYDFFAIWAFPDEETAKGFEQLVEAAGWYNYFEQVNLMGKEATAEAIIGQLIQQ